MKKITVLTGLFIASFSFAQEKLLTIQEALWKGRTVLAPKRLQSLAFINGTDKYTYVINDELLVGDNKTGKAQSVLSLKEMNSNLKIAKKDTLPSLTTVYWKNRSQFYFSNSKGELIYDLDKKVIFDTDRSSQETTLESYDKSKTGAYNFCKNDNLFVVKVGKEKAKKEHRKSVLKRNRKNEQEKKLFKKSFQEELLRQIQLQQDEHKNKEKTDSEEVEEVVTEIKRVNPENEPDSE